MTTPFHKAGGHLQLRQGPHIESLSWEDAALSLEIHTDHRAGDGRSPRAVKSSQMAVVMATSSGGLGLTEQENNQVSKWQSLPWEENEGSNTPKKGKPLLISRERGSSLNPND